MIVAALLVGLLVILAAAAGVARFAGSTVAGSPATGVDPAATPPGGSTEPVQQCSQGELALGSLLPRTGDQAFLGQPAAAALSLALADIEAAGGVLGSPVRLESADSGDAGSGLAVPAVQAQLERGVQAIIGPLATPVTLEVLDSLTEAGVAVVSPANTSPTLTDYPDNGLYFRTVPSDVLSGAVLADVARGLGLTRAVTLARADAYGTGVQQAFESAFAGLGGTVLLSSTYDPESGDFSADVSAMLSASPDVVVLAGFGESARIVEEMAAQGLGPQQVQVLVAESGVSKTAYADLPSGIMRGVLGVVPARGALPERKDFEQRLLDVDRRLTTFAYAAETYDAAILVALAAEYAGCADGVSVGAAIPAVANAGPGSTACDSFSRCLEVIGRGDQPNYEGVSGPLELNESGEPASGRVDVVRFVTNTNYRVIETVGPVDVPTP